ncbi:MAG: cytochrome ubiquinol oxidase subunit I, partial [Bacteroidales bacterium]|nr:cytochrome ubiquinol oxidase subunit I [Bacteroidales bacterium]
FFAIFLYFAYKKELRHTKWLQYVALWSIPLPFIAGQTGWVVAEMGRQPWTIQDILPVQLATSAVSPGNIITTFIIFTLLFTGMLLAEATIMVKQIKKGPDPLPEEEA